MLDYIIVGQGLAGSIIAKTLSDNNKSFLVIDHNEVNASSRVAAGVFNPVTGKRVVKTWIADTIFPFAETFYKKWDKDLGITSYLPKPIYRPFLSITQQNDVLAKSVEENINTYIEPVDENQTFNNLIFQDFGGINIKKGGHVDLPLLLDTFRQSLIEQELLLEETFDHEALQEEDGYICYKETKARKIIFCQGHSEAANNLFDWLPWSLTKGEILELEIKDLPRSTIINKGGFLLPIGQTRFLAGASYERKIDKEISEKGKNIVLEKINKIFDLPYKIIGQRAGIRPTVKDRRPFLGTHPKNKNIVIFNGLGTKGVTLGPYFAQVLFDFLEENKSLPKEVNITRYNDYYKD